MEARRIPPVLTRGTAVPPGFSLINQSIEPQRARRTPRKSQKKYRTVFRSSVPSSVFSVPSVVQFFPSRAGWVPARLTPHGSGG